MKVIIDTNVFLSHLIARAAPKVVTEVVTACFMLDEIDLLIPPEQITEFVTKATTKDYFRTRIPQSTVDLFVTQLNDIGALLPQLTDIALYSRDPNDDYLVAYAIVNEADYLITGDYDLLVLALVGRLQIVSPSQFFRLLRQQNFLG
jgi:hypothetical protein